tara:strand:+ start:409 stop:510 length:102 start_codon:yes stop_codon:yes gene_type:complete
MIGFFFMIVFLLLVFNIKLTLIAGLIIYFMYFQ